MESLPWLRYVPGYTKKIDQWHADELTLFRGQFDMAKEKLVRSVLCSLRDVARCSPDDYLADNLFSKPPPRHALPASLAINKQVCQLPLYLWYNKPNGISYRVQAVRQRMRLSVR